MTPYEFLKFKAFSIVAKGTIECSVPDCHVRHLGMLHLDHIHNDGCKQRRKTSKAGGVHCYRWAVNHPDLARKRLQILCANHDRMKQRLGSIDAIIALEQWYDNQQASEEI